MKDYVIITDSTIDLPNELANQAGIHVINMKFTVGEKEYMNYLDERQISSKDFYDLLRDGNLPTTSQINVNEYMETIKPYLEMNKDVIIFVFDSKLSGTYNSCNVAKCLLLEDYPDSNIIVVDTKSACTGEGLFVYLAAKQKANGLSITELEKWAIDNYKSINHWFTVDDIDHLKRGGRLSNGAAFAAKLLKIKPFLVCDNEGKLVFLKKVIGRKNAINMLYDKFVANYDEADKEVIFITHADCIDDAKILEEKIKASGLNIGEIHIANMGPVIGAHTGPGCLALFFKGKYMTREN